MEVYVRTNENQSPENKPAPEVIGSEIVTELALVECVLDARSDHIHPNVDDERQREEGEDPSKHIIHRPLAVVAWRGFVKVERQRHEEKDAVNAECQHVEDQKLPYTAVGFEERGGVGLIIAVVRISVCHGFLLFCF